MSKLFLREVQVLVAGLDIHSDILDIEFRIPFDDDAEPNVGEVIIYNLSPDKTNRIEKGQEIIVNAGYQGDLGTILLGTVEEKHGSWERADKLLRLVVGDGSKQWFEGVISKAYRPGVKASQVVNDLTNALGLEIGEIDLPNDVTYPRGFLAEGMLRSELQRITKDCNAKLHIVNGTIYLRPQDKSTETVVILNSDTGLIETPEKVETESSENRWNVWSLLNHRIYTDTKVQIESKTANGIFRVANGLHVCNRSDFLTQIEVVE